MIRPANRFAAGVLIASGAALLAACNSPANAPSEPSTDAAQTKKVKLGLMTSLPLYWPLDADFDALASNETSPTWQRDVLEQSYDLVLLDTLSPIAGLSSGGSSDNAEIDPLAGLDHIAIVQPRGLSPADNVALDDWVRNGGHLLLVLDPALTGEYDLALGDPGRPVDAALIPPVVKRWGLEVSFDETQTANLRFETIGSAKVPIHLAGELSHSSASDKQCGIFAAKAVASCEIGQGRVTILADAAIFEMHANAMAGGSHPMLGLLEYSFPDR